jgi:hypothetical protein
MTSSTKGGKDAEVWAQIARRIYFGEDCQDYREFLGFIFPGKIQVADPLGDLDRKDQYACYVRRPAIEDDIRKPGNRFILGNVGSGKSTMAKAYTAGMARFAGSTSSTLSPFKKTLYVIVDLSCDPDDVMTLEKIGTAIFFAFWNALFDKSPTNGKWQRKPNAPDIQPFRNDRIWMEEFRYFFVLCTHLFPEFDCADFELNTWLKAEIGTRPSWLWPSPDAACQRVVQFVTYKADVKPRAEEGAAVTLFDAVQIYIDLPDDLKNEIYIARMKELTGLLSMPVFGIEYRLFADQDRFERRNAQFFTNFQPPVVYLPELCLDELKKMLNLRLEGIETSSDGWVQKIPNQYLAINSRGILVNRLIKAAQEAAQKHPVGTPTHLLRLTRGILTLCGGHWDFLQINRPIDFTMIDQLLLHYQQQCHPME